MNAVKNERLPRRDPKTVDAKNPGYREQFGVIVLCENESDQKAIYERLHAQGLKLKVVST